MRKITEHGLHKALRNLGYLTNSQTKDTVLLSRSRKNQSDDVLKLKTPTSEDDIFAMLSVCIKSNILRTY